MPAPKICTQIDYKISISIGNKVVDSLYYVEQSRHLLDARVGIIYCELVIIDLLLIT